MLSNERKNVILNELNKLNEENGRIFDRIEITHATKINGAVEGIACKKGNVAAMVYFDDINSLADDTTIASIIFEKASVDSGYNFNHISHFRNDMIVGELINTKNNKELLEKVPHRDFLDLSVIYRAIVSREERGIISYVITNEILKTTEYTEDDLFDCAKNNMEKTIVGDPITLALGAKREIDDLFSLPATMIYLTNESYTYGAFNIFAEGILDTFSRFFGENIYLLPSSIHEWLVIPAFFQTDFLREIINQVNETELKKTEVLSDHPYLYDFSTKEILIV